MAGGKILLCILALSLLAAADRIRPYPSGGYFGDWQRSCCIIMTTVVQAPGLTVVEMYTTGGVYPLTEYTLMVNSSSGNLTYIPFPTKSPLRMDSFLYVTNNKTLFVDLFKRDPAHLFEILPELDGSQTMFLLRQQKTLDYYLVDNYPPTNNSVTFPWYNGYAARNPFVSAPGLQGWESWPNFFKDGTSNIRSVPLDSFDLLQLPRVNCTCDKHMADKIDKHGVALCKTYESEELLPSFSREPFNSLQEFGDVFNFPQPGALHGMGGKWLCNVYNTTKP